MEDKSYVAVSQFISLEKDDKRFKAYKIKVIQNVRRFSIIF